MIKQWRARCSNSRRSTCSAPTGTRYRGVDGATRRDAVGEGYTTLRVAIERSL